MSIKTLKDCAQCPVVTICSAHIHDGGWEHDTGVDKYIRNPKE
jgi:hypothetical protein